MPLPTPQPRTPMHTRRVEYRGFQREDGLWDIEGELHDTKPHAFEIEGEGVWAPHEAIHHMLIRVTLDDTMVIRDIAVVMDAHPHDPCPQAMVPMPRYRARSKRSSYSRCPMPVPDAAASTTMRSTYTNRG